MKKGTKLLSLLLAFVLVFALCGTAFAADTTAGEMAGQVVILHTNDVHGAITGYAKIAALKASYEAKGAYVLLMDAGDYSQGTTSVSLSKGANAVDLMNLAGYDVATLGNHEFDYGYEQLKTNLSTAKFPIVAANVLYNGSVAFKANTVFTAPNGTKIGVFGLDTPETATKANPTMIKGVTFSDIVTTAKAQVAALEAEKCDLIICLGHLGVDEESKGLRSTDLLASVTGIDLFIDGHSHTVIDGMKNDYATGSTMLVSTGTAFANIGVVTYAAGKLTSSLVPVTDDMTTVAAVKEKADAINKAIDAEYGTVFAKTEVTLNGSKAPGNRNMETNLGDLITDALVWQCAKSGITVDAALTNGGGIRATVKAGDITKKDINTVLPFGNTLAVVKVTGAELLEALEASTFSTPTAVGGFPQVSGIVFTVDTTKAYDAGEKYPGTTYATPKTINRVTIESVGGKAFSKTATYTIATNNFTAGGGDTYYVFANATSNVDTGYVMDEVVMDYITTKLNGTVTAADYGSVGSRIKIVYKASYIFTDVAETEWYYNAVDYAYQNKLVVGLPGGAYGTNDTMNVAQYFTVLYRMGQQMGADYPQKATTGANWMEAAKWLSAEQGTVLTDEQLATPLTRELMAASGAKFIQSVAETLKQTVKTRAAVTFTDAASITADYAKDVAYFYAISGIDGYPDGSFKPQATVRRCEVAKVLYNMLEVIEFNAAAAA